MALGAKPFDQMAYRSQKFKYIDLYRVSLEASVWGGIGVLKGVAQIERLALDVVNQCALRCREMCAGPIGNVR